jgi:hypothetical protein
MYWFFSYICADKPKSHPPITLNGGQYLIKGKTMGITKQGIFGPYQGKTGNVIGTFWKGKNVLKIRTASYSDSNTIPQQDSRMRFRLVNAFAVANNDLIRIGFSAAVNSASPYNRAVKYNLINAIAGEFPHLKLDLNLAKISLGDLVNLKNPVVTASEKTALKIDWTDNSGAGRAESADNVFISVMTEDGAEAFINDTVIKRGDTTALIQLPELWLGRTVVVVGFTTAERVIAVAKNKNQVSGSELFGRVEV